MLLLRYVPEGVEPARRAQLNRYAGLRYKAMMARERGAKAVLVVTGPNSPNAGELLPLTNDGSRGSGIVAASISGKRPRHCSRPAAKPEGTPDRARHRKSARGRRLRPAEGERETRLRHRALKKSDRNVVGYLPPAAATNT